MMVVVTFVSLCVHVYTIGYMSDDPEYKALDNEISALDSAVKGTGDTHSMFSHLRDRISAFLKRQKEHKQS